MQTPNIQVLLADAHTYSHIGLYQVLVDAGFEIIGEAKSREELWEQWSKQTAPFLLLLAENLLPDNPTLFIFELCQQQPESHIILLLNNCQTLPLPALVDAGVQGIVTKIESPQALLQTIQSVAAGQRAISPVVMDRMLQPGLPPQIALNALEEQLLQLICAEKTNPEIAVELHTSLKTVERQLTALYTKLKVKTRVGAAVWFIRHNKQEDAIAEE